MQPINKTVGYCTIVNPTLGQKPFGPGLGKARAKAGAAAEGTNWNRGSCITPTLSLRLHLPDLPAFLALASVKSTKLNGQFVEGDPFLLENPRALTLIG